MAPPAPSQHRLPSTTRIDFGFPWRDPVDGAGPPHARRSSCTYPQATWFAELAPLSAVRLYLYPTRRRDLPTGVRRCDDPTATSCHCGHGALRPVIIAPSTVRQIQDTNILLVWQRSLEALRDSEVWYIIGYSLPREDLAIRSILMRAYHARGYGDPPEVHVVQPDGLSGIDREAKEGRFRLILPDT